MKLRRVSSVVEKHSTLLTEAPQRLLLSRTAQEQCDSNAVPGPDPRTLEQHDPLGFYSSGRLLGTFRISGPLKGNMGLSNDSVLHTI
jgi:hypothetical protein